MRSLFFSSIFLFTTLISTANTLDVPFFGQGFEKALFTGSLDIKKHHLTGFLLIKKMEDESYRIVFTNQIGMTFFDFEVKQNGFKVVYCFESLNRKALIRIFEKDFRALLESTGDTITRGFLDKAEITYTKPTEGSRPGFRIRNPRIGLKMNFSLLDR